MIFDATVQAADMEITAVEGLVEIALMLALPVPISASQAMGVPFGRLRVPMSKQSAQTYGQALLDAADELPDETPKSDLIIAQNLAGVEQAVKSTEKLKGQ